MHNISSIPLTFDISLKVSTLSTKKVQISVFGNKSLTMINRRVTLSLSF